ncbi:MAG: hypothetical protein MSA90_10910 [Faecalicatena sp.]|uniref:hypothetical protein n=1 Tax=Faecalicatena sp. TaxID=2005360 RepID=UPI002584F14B|nr:hypothetical protein [Faecalicatena sp.]MCI6465963.1 hypothetical protein [Faecalicatena sp.]MDY5618620.1 hypothetical protein [Lachnospiraceae bacterium]
MKKQSPLFILIIISAFLCLFYEKGYTYAVDKQLPQELNWTEAEGDSGYILNDFDARLTRGDYNLTFEYGAVPAKESTFQLLDTNRNDGSNNLGVLIAEGVIDPNESSITIPFHLEEDSYALQLRFSDQVPLQTWKVELVRDYYTDGIFLFILLAVFIYLFYWKLDWKKPQYTILLTGAAILITLPFVGNLLMDGHDISFHLSRIKGIAESLALGQFPVRMNVNINQGYGFVSEILYPNLFVYIPGILYALGVSLITAYKIWILLINIATALVGYYSFKGLFKSQKLGAICAFFYLVNPYRLNNIFLRASIGEVLAEIFLPLLVYAMAEMVYGNSKRWWLLAISAVGILQSHILTLEMCIMFGLFFCVLNWRRLCSKDGACRILNCMKAAGISVLLNLWFLVPFLDQFTKGYTIVEEVNDVATNCVFLFQMFLSHFKVAGVNVVNGIYEEMPITMGSVVLFGSILFLYYGFGKKSLDPAMQKIGNTCLIMGAASCLMATEYFPWSFLQKYCWPVYKFLSKLQFPWRMLGFASLFLSIVTTIAVYALYQDGRNILAGAILIFSGVLMLECMDGYMTDGTPLINSRNQDVELMSYNDYYRLDLYIGDIWRLKDYGERVVSNQNISITDFRKQGVDVRFHFKNQQQGAGREKIVKLQMPLYNYEMHRAYINGEEVKTETGKYGLMNLTVPKGVSAGDVEVVYVGRKLYQAADLASLGCAVILGIYVVLRKRRPQIPMKRRIVE